MAEPNGQIPWLQIIMWFVGLLVSVTALYSTMSRARRQEMEHLRTRVTQLETKVEIFWRSVALDAAKILHSPDPAHARRDALLEKYVTEALSHEELQELIEMLGAVLTSHETSSGERVAASMILRALEAHYGMVAYTWQPAQKPLAP